MDSNSIVLGAAVSSSLSWLFYRSFMRKEQEQERGQERERERERERDRDRDRDRERDRERERERDRERDEDEDEDEDDYVFCPLTESDQQRHEQLKAEVKRCQLRYDQNPNDPERLRMLGNALCSLGNCRGNGVTFEQMEAWVLDGISKLDEALNINENDYEARYVLTIEHCRLFKQTLQEDRSFIVEHARKAYEHRKYLKEKVPNITETPEVFPRYIQELGLIEAENLKIPGTTLTRLGHPPAEALVDLEQIHDGISTLEEALKITVNDNEARYHLGNAHYCLFMQAVTQDDIKMEHCRKAYEYFMYIKEKAPGFYKIDPNVLDCLQSYLAWKSSQKTTEVEINTEFQINQELVEKLVEAQPDCYRELVEEMALFYLVHKRCHYD